MNGMSPARAGSHRAPWLALAGMAVAIALIGSVGDRPVSSAPALRDIPREGRADRLGEADGLIPDGASVFDRETPAVANLDPALLEALRSAAIDAGADGIAFRLNSGWRSPTYQEQLFREAVAEHGSAQEAARWVATANGSAHVSGDAVDIGPSDALAWLSTHGARYGLCQVYRNEPWHYELRADAAGRGCPPMYADSSAR